MSIYDEARDLVIERLDNIIDGVTSESYAAGEVEKVRALHIQSIIYRLMDQV